MFANIKLSKLVGSIARHAATIIGTYLIARQIPNELVQPIVGAVLTGGAFIASVLEKREK